MPKTDLIWEALERQVLEALLEAYVAGNVEVAGIEDLPQRIREAVAVGLTARLG